MNRATQDGIFNFVCFVMIAIAAIHAYGWISGLGIVAAAYLYFYLHV